MIEYLVRKRNALAPCLPLLGFVLALQWIPSAWTRADDARDTAIPVIGLDANGRSLVREVSDAAYRASLSQVVTSVRDSFHPALGQNSTAIRNWELHTVGVGVSVRGLAGIEGVWSISGNKKLRLIFSDSNRPVYPN